jgi:hypothetical protein
MIQYFSSTIETAILALLPSAVALLTVIVAAVILDCSSPRAH